MRNPRQIIKIVIIPNVEDERELCFMKDLFLVFSGVFLYLDQVIPEVKDHINTGVFSEIEYYLVGLQPLKER